MKIFKIFRFESSAYFKNWKVKHIPEKEAMEDKVGTMWITRIA